MASSAEIATRNQQNMERQNAPRTEYTLRLAPDQYQTQDAGPAGGGGVIDRNGRRVRGMVMRHQPAPAKSGIKGALTNPHLITGAWMVAMATIAVDEWKRNHIFPRPSRLWWTTLTFGILGLLAMSELMAPLAGALAVGYAIALLWQYYNGSGQFTTGATLV